MPTIWFSLSGEGRGHATRVRTLVEALRGEHRIRLFAPGAAFEFLSDVYAATDVEVTRIPGLMFRYRGDRLTLAGTLADATRYVRLLSRLVAALRREIDRDPPDLAVWDFEPALPRAARAAGGPLLSLDHQHFFLACDLSDLPWGLFLQARMMVPVVMAACPAPAETVVSSFYFPPLRPGLRNVTRIGPLLRPALLDAEPTDGRHLVAYFRRFAPPHLLDTLARCGREVLVYGLGERPPASGLRFRPIADDSFLVDLASCAAVVCNAGNQLVGEALALGKPVLAIPEESQFEQFINAHYLRAGGGGDWLRLREFGPDSLARFLTNLDRFRGKVDRDRLRGNPAALAAIRCHLPARALV